MTGERRKTVLFGMTLPEIGIFFIAVSGALITYGATTNENKQTRKDLQKHELVADKKFQEIKRDISEMRHDIKQDIRDLRILFINHKDEK